jgi:hypothetical protein
MLVAPAGGLACVPDRARPAPAGHSLGGFIAEVATVMSDELAQAKGWVWSCCSFDSPGGWVDRQWA